MTLLKPPLTVRSDPKFGGRVAYIDTGDSAGRPPPVAVYGENAVQMAEQIKRAVEAHDELVAALEYYADEHSWEPTQRTGNAHFCPRPPSASLDRGKKARAAIARAEPPKPAIDLSQDGESGAQLEGVESKT